MFVSETYSIEDCFYYDSQTVDKSRYTVTSGTANISYSSNGVTITGNSSSTCIITNNALTLPSEYKATFEITACNGDAGSNGTEYGGVVFDDWFTDWRSTNTSTTYKYSTTSQISTGLSKIQAGSIVKIVRENNSMKLYVDDVLQCTDNNINHTGYFRHRSYKRSGSNGRSLTIKDLKIKPL